MRTRSILSALLLMAIIQTSMAQSVVINYSNGTQEKHSVSSIESITFEESSSPSSPLWVDLKLPSGTLWATCNVGAGSPEETGDYFAWGETEPKQLGYWWDNYKYCVSNNEKWLTKYVLDPGWSYTGDSDWKSELEETDDAAAVNLGAGWRMPSMTQQDELFNSSNTTQEWTASNGVSGLLITSVRNGKSIFLPATGFWWNGELTATETGYYSSRTLDTELDTDSWFMCADERPGNCGTLSGSRCFGRPVRPVYDKASAEQTYTVNGVSFTMIPVVGGTFQMGSTSGENDEKPVHLVTLSSFSIGQTEVTQELWQAVMGTNPSRFKGSNLPVEMVSWNDCQTFITKLNQLTGKTFRLPTEAEWEFAARGGKLSKGYTYSGSNVIDDVAWYHDNSSDKTHEVATKAPNELGIYDMSGNVYEWCQDWYSDKYYSESVVNNPNGPSSASSRVNRGGGWYGSATYCRVANRGGDTPSSTFSIQGLRLAQ